MIRFCLMLLALFCLHQQASAEAMSSAGVIPHSGTIEVGFSPEGSAEALVQKVIRSSQASIRLMAYSFTSPKITRALIDAKHRGIDVRVVADQDANESSKQKGRSALAALVNAGVPVRLVDRFAILHDKVLVVDGQHVQTGSYNYSEAAASKNSENVLVVWGHPQLASVYLKHWENRFAVGVDFRPY